MLNYNNLRQNTNEHYIESGSQEVTSSILVSSTKNYLGDNHLQIRVSGVSIYMDYGSTPSQPQIQIYPRFLPIASTFPVPFSPRIFHVLYPPPYRGGYVTRSSRVSKFIYMGRQDEEGEEIRRVILDNALELNYRLVHVIMVIL